MNRDRRYNPRTMRRAISIALTLVLLICTSVAPALALASDHACCLARAAAAAQGASCHRNPRAPSSSISETHNAGAECPNRCCLGTASRAAQPESPRTSAVALHFFADAPAAQSQPLSQAELPAPSGRAPPSRFSC